MGLNVPKEDDDKVSGSLAEAKKEDAKKKLSVNVMDNVWGLLVFPDDRRHAEFLMHGELSVAPSDSLYWLDGLEQLWGGELELDECSEDAVGLLGFASMEVSPRSAFLVTYLALERLVPVKKRSPQSLDLLQRLQGWVHRARKRKHRPIAKEDEQALLGSIGRLRYESVGNALTHIAHDNPSLEVEGEPILQFIKRCISTRHATAHPGKLSPGTNYAQLAKGLRKIAMGILWSKHGIPDLSVNVPASSVSFPPGALQARVISYERG